jgi:hypothetical protein
LNIGGIDGIDLLHLGDAKNDDDEHEHTDQGAQDVQEWHQHDLLGLFMGALLHLG